jgi:hypothetical protein
VDELKIDQDPPSFFNFTQDTDFTGSRRHLALFHAALVRKKEIMQQSKPATPVKKTEPLIDEDPSKIIPCASPPPRWLDKRRR